MIGRRVVIAALLALLVAGGISAPHNQLADQWIGWLRTTAGFTASESAPVDATRPESRENILARSGLPTGALSGGSGRLPALAEQNPLGRVPSARHGPTASTPGKASLLENKPSQRSESESAPDAQAGASPFQAVPKRPWSHPTPEILALKTHDALAFHYDPEQHPNGLRIYADAAQPLQVSLHGPGVAKALVNGTPAIENHPYPVSAGIEIESESPVGVHVRPGNAPPTRGPNSNG